MRSSSADAAESIPDLNAVAAKHQRVDGLARVQFKTAIQGRTALADLYQRAPCRVLFPTSEAGDSMQAVLLTTSGGLTGGDRTRVELAIDAGAQATVTTQAAEKLYRALPEAGDAQIEVDLTVGARGWAEWLAQETILFNGSRLRRSFVADVAPDGQLLAVDSLVFGRTAMGEAFEVGRIHDSWRISREGRLVWADALHLEGDLKDLRTLPFGFGTAVACSTLVYVGTDSMRHLGEVRRLIDEHALPGAATAFNGLLVVRLLAENAADLRGAVMTLATGIRRAAAGLPARMPRVWHC
jgi:urease accessory protein